MSADSATNVPAAPASPRVILASAGSGKTWQLSRAYLALLEAGQPTSSLLATTFTRKAAGEILQRVLEHLLEDAEPALLGSFARDLSHGRVQTLDAFFVRLATRFAQELGLPPGFRLGTEPELAALRAQAVSRALEDAAPRELASLLRQVQSDGAGRRVHETLLDVVEEGHELMLDSAAEAWAPLKALPRLDAATLEAALSRFEHADVPVSGTGSKAKPNGHWVKAQAAVCAAVFEERWEGMLTKGLGHALLAGELYQRHDFPAELRAALEPLVEHARGVLLAGLMAAGRAFRALLERYDAALGACQRSSGCYGFADVTRLLRGGIALDGAATALRDEGRLSHLLLDEFQDTSVAQWRVLQPLVESCLAARDGSRSLFCVGDVKQSIYGWRNGEPELLLALSKRPGIKPEELDVSRRSAQVVLDVVNRVFTGLPARGVFGVNDETYRAALVTAATHWTALFRAHVAHDQELAGCASLREVSLPDDADGDSESRRRAVLDAACAHVAKLVARAPGARIGILVRSRKAIAPLILGLRERGVAACGEGGNQLTDSAAVLAALSLFALVDHPGDTAAAFHVATSPLAPALGITPEQACEPALASRGGREARPAALPLLQAATALRVRLQRDGFGALLTEWSALVAAAPTCSAWDRARFAQLADLGFAHDGRAGLRVDDFVATVREQRVEDPGGASVRVLTVHGAKGLEYDAVVLPDLDYGLPRPSGSGSRFLSSRRGPDGAEIAAGPVTAILPRTKKELRVLDPRLAELDGLAYRRAMEEQLSVLYVALTRAKVRLDLFIEARREGSGQRSCRFGELLRDCLVDPASASGAATDADGVLFAAGDETVAWPPRGMGAASDAAAGVAPGVAPLVAASPLSAAFDAARQRLPRTRTPSSGAHAAAFTARELLAAPPRAALERGLLLHRFCQEVEWLPDATADGAAPRDAGRRPAHGPSHGPSRDVLLAAARELVARRDLRLDEATLESGLADFARLLDLPAAKSVFVRPACAPPGMPLDSLPTVWRERRFAVSPRAGELLRGAFDRVVIWRHEGRAVAAEVIDFKTDAPPSACAAVGGDAGSPGRKAAGIEPWLVERVARYTPQMRDYRAALSVLTGLSPAFIACRLLFLQADALHEVPGDP